MSYNRFTPPTINPRNQLAIDALLEAYGHCLVLEDFDHKHAFNIAINALRQCNYFICRIEQAREIKYKTDGAMGQFMVSAATGELPRALADLRIRRERLSVA